MNKPAIASNWLLEVSNLRRGDIGCLLGPSHQPARPRSAAGKTPHWVILFLCGLMQTT